jgi:hypothetical protein
MTDAGSPEWLAEVLEFEGRCGLERCPRIGVGHWTEPVTFRLRTNKARTRFWYESSCAPGLPQPSSRLHWRAEVLDRRGGPRP